MIKRISSFQQSSQRVASEGRQAHAFKSGKFVTDWSRVSNMRLALVPVFRHFFEKSVTTAVPAQQFALCLIDEIIRLSLASCTSSSTFNVSRALRQVSPSVDLVLFDIHCGVPGAIQVLSAQVTFTSGMTVRGNEATDNGGGETVNEFCVHTLPE